MLTPSIAHRFVFTRLHFLRLPSIKKGRGLSAQSYAAADGKTLGSGDVLGVVLGVEFGSA